MFWACLGLCRAGLGVLQCYEDWTKRFEAFLRISLCALSPRGTADPAAAAFPSGFYPINHTDCLHSLSHHCFDGTTGELAHAFFPPHGEIHFDDHEYWILGNTRFSWKKGVWLTDLVHVAAHEIGHALGLMHSLNPRALMHINATLTGRKSISQDEVWGIHRLYGCKDRLPMCPGWAQKGFCEQRRKLMKKHCPASCDFCYGTGAGEEGKCTGRGENVKVHREGVKIHREKGKVHREREKCTGMGEKCTGKRKKCTGKR
uniref:ShKT domain-containing protein n=1 Tax=Zonotrichia albicollis TaxID=44394 RepID=A0A8D2M822_ZONAL